MPIKTHQSKKQYTVFHSKNSPIPFRFKTKIEFTEHLAPNVPKLCWQFTGAIQKSGHGRVWHNKKMHLVHRLVYKMYGNPLEDNEVLRHKCHNPACCNPAHLTPGTQHQNMQDKVKADRQPKGETHINSKLTDNSAFAIKHLSITTTLTQHDLATMFNVSKRSIHNVVTGKTWGHI